jgi:hypothetical protein
MVGTSIIMLDTLLVGRMRKIEFRESLAPGHPAPSTLALGTRNLALRHCTSCKAIGTYHPGSSIGNGFLTYAWLLFALCRRHQGPGPHGPTSLISRLLLLRPNSYGPGSAKSFLVWCLRPRHFTTTVGNDRRIRVAKVFEHLGMDTLTSYALHTWRFHRPFIRITCSI